MIRNEILSALISRNSCPSKRPMHFPTRAIRIKVKNGIITVSFMEFLLRNENVLYLPYLHIFIFARHLKVSAHFFKIFWKTLPLVRSASVLEASHSVASGRYETYCIENSTHNQIKMVTCLLKISN